MVITGSLLRLPTTKIHQEIERMEADFAKVTTDASGLAADMVRVRSERAEAEQQTDGMGSGGRCKLDVTCGK